MNGLLVKIGQLAIFIICAQTLLHFRAKESYEKYIKLLVSIMLLILIVEPIMDFLGGKGRKGSFLERIQVYEEELEGVLVCKSLDNSEIEAILTSITCQVTEGASGTAQEKGKQKYVVKEEAYETEDTKEEEAGIKIKEIESVEVTVPYGQISEAP